MRAGWRALLTNQTGEPKSRSLPKCLDVLGKYMFQGEDGQVHILDRVTGSDPKVTDDTLEEPAKCPNCCREILEKTLIEPM